MDKKVAVISALFEKKNKRKPKNSKELLDFIKQQGGEEFLKKVDEYISQAEAEQSKQALKAAHGAKLQYFKKLKNQCADDEEVIYYKKGGSVNCGCKKKEDGGEVRKAGLGCSAIDKFKAKMKSGGDTLSIANRITNTIATITNTKQGFDKARKIKENSSKKSTNVVVNGTTKQPMEEAQRKNTKKPFKNDYSSKRVKDSEKDYLKGKTNEATAEKCGGKVKKHQEGSVIAKFKALRKGGSLNGIPFMLQGSFKGGVLYRFRRSTNDMNNGYKTYSDLIMMTLDPLGRPTYDTPPILAGRTIYVTPLGNDTIFYTNNDIFNKTPKGDSNLKRAKLKFYQLIKKAPIEGEEYRMTPYWNSNLFNLDAVRNRALKGN